MVCNMQCFQHSYQGQKELYAKNKKGLYHFVGLTVSKRDTFYITNKKHSKILELDNVFKSHRHLKTVINKTRRIQ